MSDDIIHYRDHLLMWIRRYLFGLSMRKIKAEQSIRHVLVQELMDVNATLEKPAFMTKETSFLEDVEYRSSWVKEEEQ